MTPFYDNRKLEEAQEDCKAARRIDRYRVGEKALYLPYGFGWKYILKEDIIDVETSHANIRQKGCMATPLRIPAAVVTTKFGAEKLVFDRVKSLDLLVEALTGRKVNSEPVEPIRCL